MGRSDLRSPAVRARLVGVGILLGVLGYGGGLLATRLAAGQPESTLRLLDTEPHADSTFELAGDIGVALVVIAICLVIADRWPRALFALASTGALALTPYTVHIMVIAAMGPEVEWAMHEISGRVAATAIGSGTPGGAPPPAADADGVSSAPPQGQTSSRSQPAPPRR